MVPSTTLSRSAPGSVTGFMRVITKAAFLTRGIAEIARLGAACGAEALTFAGLTGIGDLIATCSSPQSRNHRVGIALAGEKSLPEILDSMGEVAEGVPTTRAAHDLGRKLNVELPIIDQMYEVLFNDKSPAEAIETLMEPEPRREGPDPAGQFSPGSVEPVRRDTAQ